MSASLVSAVVLICYIKENIYSFPETPRVWYPQKGFHVFLTTFIISCLLRRSQRHTVQGMSLHATCTTYSTVCEHYICILHTHTHTYIYIYIYINEYICFSVLKCSKVHELEQYRRDWNNMHVTTMKYIYIYIAIVGNKFDIFVEPHP
jgi:hypothetical protein